MIEIFITSPSELATTCFATPKGIELTDVVFWDHHYVTYHESLPPCTHLRRAHKAGMHPLNHIIPKTSVRRLFCFYPWIYSQKSLIGSTKQLLGLDDKVLMSPENRGFILQRALI